MNKRLSLKVSTYVENKLVEKDRDCRQVGRKHVSKSKQEAARDRSLCCCYIPAFTYIHWQCHFVGGVGIVHMDEQMVVEIDAMFSMKARHCGIQCQSTCYSKALGVSHGSDGRRVATEAVSKSAAELITGINVWDIESLMESGDNASPPGVHSPSCSRSPWHANPSWHSNGQSHSVHQLFTIQAVKVHTTKSFSQTTQTHSVNQTSHSPRRQEVFRCRHYAQPILGKTMCPPKKGQVARTRRESFRLTSSIATSHNNRQLDIYLKKANHQMGANAF